MAYQLSVTHHHEDERCQKSRSFQISTWTLGHHFNLLRSFSPFPMATSFSTMAYLILQKVWLYPWSCKNPPSHGPPTSSSVRLGPKISETVKGKLSLGARILQLGGVKRVFKQIFGVEEGEKLLKASQCYLSTTAGPLAGLLFISTQRVAFCSERSIKFFSPNGELVRFHYKVSIPLRKVKRVDPSENVKNPSQKYMEIVTLDNFDFWFMGFLNYQKSFNCLQQALSQS
uniref:GRAM domain-containing protein n=1 Tax=Vitis vinifera TaxID=29760 RepID=F6GX32_VITVI